MAPLPPCLSEGRWGAGLSAGFARSRAARIRVPTGSDAADVLCTYNVGKLSAVGDEDLRRLRQEPACLEDTFQGIEMSCCSVWRMMQ